MGPDEEISQLLEEVGEKLIQMGKRQPYGFGFGKRANYDFGLGKRDLEPEHVKMNFMERQKARAGLERGLLLDSARERLMASDLGSKVEATKRFASTNIRMMGDAPLDM